MATAHLAGDALSSTFIRPRDAARLLNRSYSHVMHMLERGELGGMKVLDRWLLSPDDLAAYRERRYGALRNLATTALEEPHVQLTGRQRAICAALADEQTCSTVARQLGISRQAVHAQISLIRRKIAAPAE